MYVQNQGVEQVWVGKIRKTEEGNLSVLIIYATEGASKEFKVSDELTLKSHDVKPIIALSVEAIAVGFR